MNEVPHEGVVAFGMPATSAPDGVRYVGFWARSFASVVDSVIVLFALVPAALLLELLGLGVGKDDPGSALLIQLLIGAIVLAFWMTRMATPGKMILDAVIVDAATLQKPSWRQYLARYLGYFVAFLPFGLGLLWVAFDRRKQGWHDKIAGTVVIRRPAN